RRADGTGSPHAHGALRSPRQPPAGRGGGASAAPRFLALDRGRLPRSGAGRSGLRVRARRQERRTIAFLYGAGAHHRRALRSARSEPAPRVNGVVNRRARSAARGWTGSTDGDGRGEDVGAAGAEGPRVVERVGGLDADHGLPLVVAEVSQGPGL